MPKSVRLPTSEGREQSDGQVLYQVSVELEIAGVVRGRLLRDDRSPAIDALVGAFPMSGDVPRDVDCPAEECDSSGNFVVRTISRGSYVLACKEEGYRPLTIPVGIEMGSVLDVGTLFLDRGLRISGYAQSGGVALAGASVCYSLAVRGERRTMIGRSDSKQLLWTNGSFESDRAQPTNSAADGSFAFDGLGPHEYYLYVCGLPEVRIGLGGLRPEFKVRAPQDGVVVELGFSTVRFELSDDLPPESEGHLTVGTPGVVPAPISILGREESIATLTPPETHLVGELAFPGRRPFKIDLVTLKAGQELTVPVPLPILAEAGRLVLKLDAPGVDLPGEFVVSMSPVDGPEAQPLNKQVEVVDGGLVLDGLVPGHYRVRVRAGPLAGFTTTLIDVSELDLELRPGEEVRRELHLKLGAGLRLTVRDEDGALISGSYSLLDSAGTKVVLEMRVQTESTVYGTNWQLLPYGTHQSTNPLDPGKYELLLTSEGFQEQRVSVDLVAGRYEDVQVTLRH
jgi:hypothetical protein